MGGLAPPTQEAACSQQDKLFSALQVCFHRDASQLAKRVMLSASLLALPAGCQSRLHERERNWSLQQDTAWLQALRGGGATQGPAEGAVPKQQSADELAQGHLWWGTASQAPSSCPSTRSSQDGSPEPSPAATARGATEPCPPAQQHRCMTGWTPASWLWPARMQRTDPAAQGSHDDTARSSAQTPGCRASGTQATQDDGPGHQRPHTTQATQDDGRKAGGGGPGHQRPHTTQGPSDPAAAERQAQCKLGHRLVYFGEVLAIVRPLVYVSMLRRCGRRSWLPWIAALVCDLLSRALTLRGHELLAQVRHRSRHSVAALGLCAAGHSTRGWWLVA